MRRLTFPILLLVLAVSSSVAQEPTASEPIDQDINAKIRAEVSANSQVMSLLHQLTDVHGPRLTGSPNLENAGKWAIATMEGWGLTNGTLEPWNWNHEGWRGADPRAGCRRCWPPSGCPSAAPRA